MIHTIMTLRLLKLSVLFIALMPILFSASPLYARSSAQLSSEPSSEVNSIENMQMASSASLGQLTESASGAVAAGTASIRNFVWEDTDLDGIQLSNFGENPIPGVTVTLYHSNGLLAGIRTTNRDGYSAFANISAGDYYLAFDFPRGLVPTHRNRGDDSTMDSDVDQITGLTGVFRVEEGGAYEAVDVGLTHAGSISSMAWSDLNFDGVRDPDEPGVPATVVTLYDENDEIVQIVPTDARGYFEFPLITPGTYTLEFLPSPGMSFTQQGVVRSSSFNSAVDPRTGRTTMVQVTAGPNEFDWGAGLVRLVPTALETVAEPTQLSAQVEQFSMKLFIPFIGAASLSANVPDSPFFVSSQ